MSKKHGFLIPDVISPLDSVCVPVQVPNDPKHIYAFFGALEVLGEWYSWQREATKSGKDVAAVWRNVVKTARENFGSCSMALDCNEVEACLATSATIIAIQNAIAAAEADIAQNTNAISTNANNITNNQNAITANTNNISQNTSDIAALLTTQQQQQLTLDDHESRITVLENAPTGAGGNLDILTSTIVLYNNNNRNTTSTTFVTPAAVKVPHTFTYDTALIIAEVTHANTVGSQSSFIAIDLNAVYGISVNRVLGSVFRSTMISETFQDIPTGISIDIGVGHRTSSGGTSRIAGFGTIVYTIIEYGNPNNPPEPLVDPVVTFDDGGAPYTLPIQNTVGYVGGTGNPSFCLRSDGYPLETDKAAIEIDLGEAKQIDNISWDLYSDDQSDNIAFLYVDDVYIDDWTGSSIPDNQWDNKPFTFTTGLPVTGQVIRIEFGRQITGNQTDFRVDNIFIDTGGV